MFDRELVKGSTSLIVLQVLSKKDMYGYEIVKEMEKSTDQQLLLKEGTLYPALHKLENQGYISSYWMDMEKGPARKYYKVTNDGKLLLQKKTSEWTKFVSMINKVINNENG
ncbi:PadR family transcriptional regulator [Metabacillus arenae]|uniref:PadR family transcriptional regulator n=1 Tax=Metabacillus arenae TaxID=2771434 RepID=A0A926NJI7_9BACI|nr:PadR family transcriptional regulator [Metabacillus arenae]MBD1379011.1 PadR family transcriptional regulator [Metabacillus arenae]